MFKKSLLAFLALTLILVLFIPAALADDTATQPAEQQTTEPQATDQQTTEPQTTDQQTAEPKDASEGTERQPIKTKDKSGITDTGLGEKDDVSAMALDSVGPTRYKKSLTYISKYHVYIGYTTYTAPTTGFYTFYSLTNQDTDIEFDYEDDSDPIDYDYRIGAPFSMWVFLDAGESYDIWFYNYGSSSTISYLMTTPLTLGTTAYSVSAKGYSTRWMQAFDFVVPEAGDYSLRVTCPSGSKFSLSLWEGTEYVWEEIDPETGDGYYTFNPIAASGYITSELYHTFSLEPGTYHFSFLFNNKTSTTAPFTIAMDNDNGIDPAMSEGVIYTSPGLETNDTLTARYFIPAKKGTYKLTCDRSNAKITVISEEGLETNTYLAKNVSPDTIVYLNGDTKYYIYYATDGTEGEIKYSAVYVPSVECSLIGISSPFSFALNNRVLTATVAGETSLVVDGVTVSDYATWKTLDSNRDDLPVLNTIALNEGLNRAYIQVTSEDGAHVMEYPVLIYNLSAEAFPSIVAFDSEYNEIESGTVTNLNVSAVILGQSPLTPIVVTRNGSYFTWNGSAAFTQTGVYTVNATDGNGNSAAPFTFTIDRTAPLITAKDSSNIAVANNGLSGKSVTITVTDANPGKGVKEATKDGLVIDWPSDNTFTDHGVYTITSYDAAANKSTFKFTIDKVPPVISAACGATPVVNNGFVNGNVIVTVTDPNYKSKSVKKNGVSISWPSYSKFVYAGKYDITATDKAGNTAKFTFTIDKTKPSITAKYLNKYTLYDKGYSRYDVTVSVKDTYLNTKEVTLNDAEYTWPVTNIFTEQGKYVVKAYDKGGNITSFTFTIDKTLPVITALSGVTELSSGKCVNTNVTVSFEDASPYTKYVKKNGDSIKWPTSNTFTSNGNYVVTAKDRAGNAKTFSFIIDKTNPAISVKTVYGSTVSSGGKTKYDVYVKIIDLNQDTKTITLNGDPIAWPSTNKFTQEGNYVVTATDRAGNTVSAAYTFTIYKPARFTVTEENSGHNVINNGYANDEEVTIDFYEPFYSSKTLTKKGSSEPISWPDDPKAITVKGEGVYTATVRDTYGSVSTFTFTIDTTFPDIKVYTSSSDTMMSDYLFCNASYVKVNVTDTNLASKVAAKNGKNISWPSYSKFVYEGVYLITAVDKAGNTAYYHFIIDRSKPVITCKTATNKTVLNNGITNESATITITDRVGLATITYKLDDAPETTVSETFTLTLDGVYTITATDALGYKNTFKFTLDKTKPVITATNTSGSIPDLGYSNSDVTVTVDGATKKSVTKNNVAMTYPSSGKFTAAGVYKVTATDAAGNKQYFTFTIDKTAPVFTAVLTPGNTAVGFDATVNSDVKLTISNLNPSNFGSVIVNKALAAYKKYPLAGSDDASLLWDVTLSSELTLTENGFYEVTLTDAAGNKTTLIFTIQKTI